MNLLMWKYSTIICITNTAQYIIFLYLKAKYKIIINGELNCNKVYQ